MKNDKEISIDQFTADEKILVEQRVKMLTDKLSHIANKKEEKEILKEAKRLVMKERVTRESSKQVLAKRPRRPSAAKESEIKDFDWAASLRKNPRALK
ncbi:hypothetical protein [Erwinia amylovora]|uniref:hypothetical protein n=1 Tax=Erwinia amylovora TaxID=552 RepID=UPI000C088466|nr:hypothetical protein [Erwinia amylovora]